MARRRVCYRLYPLNPWRVGPCDVLLVGEAPGPHEDDSGIPFSGPSGQYLDVLLGQALQIFRDRSGRPITPRIGITNIVACQPLTEYRQVRPPSAEEAKACQTRLLQLLSITRHRLVVTLGEVAKRFFPKDSVLGAYGLPNGIPRIHIPHPASILRTEYPRRVIRETEAVSSLVSAFSLAFPRQSRVAST